MPKLNKTENEIAPEEIDEGGVTEEDTEDTEETEDTEAEEIEFVNTKFEEGEFDRVTYLSEALGITKVAAREAFYHVIEAIQYEAFYNGSSRTNMGTINLHEVPERSGVSKMSGEEKPWTSPAHYTLKLKVNAACKNFLNETEEEEA